LEVKPRHLGRLLAAQSGGRQLARPARAHSQVPRIEGTQVLTATDKARLRADIERLFQRGTGVNDIADMTLMPERVIMEQLAIMRRSSFYDPSYYPRGDIPNVPRSGRIRLPGRTRLVCASKEDLGICSG
jgi:hypothetical protein